MIWVLRGQLAFLALMAVLAALNWATSGPTTLTLFDHWKRHH